ncbi:hypothetical protein FOMG_14890 [Fusarium oxysporum f. sp. melonis 26406]|nr:hypothetical protein FOMG_14890 [Fusarium oxysporum f. sp. melonis 26406]
MIPPDALMEQPIPLRNPLLSYLGHMPTFEDIHLTRATNSKPTEPAYYHQIFERGIDPDVDNPSKFHDHSELPDVFLCLEDILQYREHVKARIMALYESEKPYTDRCIGRALWIARLCKARKRSYFTTPSKSMDRRAQADFNIGYHDPESDDGPNRFFAWDNEREPYEITVPPIKIPATWSKTRDARSDEEYTTFVARHSIKTVWGPVPLSQALDWPVVASFDEVERYAQRAGACSPTLHELRSIHEHVERRRKALDSKVNHQFHTDPKAIFVDLSDMNSGFQNFHPMGITHKDDLCGLGDTGGAADSTRTLFAPQPGFKPMDVYPGYSADFMDQTASGRSWRKLGPASSYCRPKELTEVDGGICGGFVDAFASPVVTSYDIN